MHGDGDGKRIAIQIADANTRVLFGGFQVTIKRTDLNRHFTVREIIKASEDGFNRLLHKTGIAHVEHFFGRMFYASAIKAKFVKEMPIHSFSRTR